MTSESFAKEMRTQKFLCELQVSGKTSCWGNFVTTFVLPLCGFLYCILLQHVNMIWTVEPWVVLLNGAYIFAYAFLSNIGTISAPDWADGVARHRKNVIQKRYLSGILWWVSIICRLWVAHDAVLQIDDGLIHEFIQLHPDSREVLAPSSLHMFGVEMKAPQKLDGDVNDAMKNFEPTPCQWTDAVQWIKEGDAIQYARCIQWLHLLEPWEQNSEKVIQLGDLKITTRQTVWCSPQSREYGDALHQYQKQQQKEEEEEKEFQSIFEDLGIVYIGWCPKRQLNGSAAEYDYTGTLSTGAKNFEVLPVSVDICKLDTDKREMMWLSRARDSVCLLVHWAMPHLFSRRTLVILLAIVLPQVHPARQLVTQVILCSLAIAWRDGASSMELGKYVCAVFMLVLWLMITYYIECQEPDDNKWSNIKYAKDYVQNIPPEALDQSMAEYINDINYYLILDGKETLI